MGGNPVTGAMVVGALWVMGLLVALVEIRFPRARKTTLWFGLVSTAAAASLAGLQWPGDPKLLLAGEGIEPDGFACYIQVFVLLGVLCCLLLQAHMPSRWFPGSTGLTLMAAAGASMLAIASGLVGMLAGFVGALIPLWGFAAISRGEHGREAALKGMVVGAMGAALLGLGAAFVLARAKTTNLVGISAFLKSAGWIGSDPLLVAGLALVLSGVGCFIAAVPFHMWFVDVVEGLPAPASLLLSGGLMASGLAAVCRMLLTGFQPLAASGPGYLSWTAVLHGVGIAALLVCNALALVQRSLKRMAAYLAAGQAGLVLVTLAAIGKIGAEQPAAVLQRAVGGVLVFVAVHAVNWIGLFVAVEAIGDEGGQDPGIGRLEGLVHKHPWLASAIGLALLCMAGMPPTAGFFSRLYLLEAMVEAGWTGTAVAAALSLGLVLVMSLGLVAAMVMRAEKPVDEVRTSPSLILVAAFSSMAILFLGILPGGILDIAIRSAASLLIGQ